MSEYTEKFKDPRWQKKRLEILDDRGWACELCCRKEKTLHVHHVCYFKGKDPWEYEDHLLRVLCEECHEDEHCGDDPVVITADFIQCSYGLTSREVENLLWYAFDILIRSEYREK